MGASSEEEESEAEEKEEEPPKEYVVLRLVVPEGEEFEDAEDGLAEESAGGKSGSRRTSKSGSRRTSKTGADGRSGSRRTSKAGGSEAGGEGRKGSRRSSKAGESEKDGEGRKASRRSSKAGGSDRDGEGRRASRRSSEASGSAMGEDDQVTFDIYRDESACCGFRFDAKSGVVLKVDHEGPAAIAGMTADHVEWQIVQVDDEDVTPEIVGQALRATREPGYPFTLTLRKHTVPKPVLAWLLGERSFAIPPRKVEELRQMLAEELPEGHRVVATLAANEDGELVADDYRIAAPAKEETGDATDAPDALAEKGSGDVTDAPTVADGPAAGGGAADSDAAALEAFYDTLEEATKRKVLGIRPNEAVPAFDDLTAVQDGLLEKLEALKAYYDTLEEATKRKVLGIKPNEAVSAFGDLTVVQLGKLEAFKVVDTAVEDDMGVDEERVLRLEEKESETGRETFAVFQYKFKVIVADDKVAALAELLATEKVDGQRVIVQIEEIEKPEDAAALAGELGSGQGSRPESREAAAAEKPAEQKKEEQKKEEEQKEPKEVEEVRRYYDTLDEDTRRKALDLQPTQKLPETGSDLTEDQLQKVKIHQAWTDEVVYSAEYYAAICEVLKRAPVGQTKVWTTKGEQLTLDQLVSLEAVRRWTEAGEHHLRQQGDWEKCGSPKDGDVVNETLLQREMGDFSKTAEQKGYVTRQGLELQDAFPIRLALQDEEAEEVEPPPDQQVAVHKFEFDSEDVSKAFQALCILRKAQVAAAVAKAAKEKRCAEVALETAALWLRTPERSDCAVVFFHGQGETEAVWQAVFSALLSGDGSPEAAGAGKCRWIWPRAQTWPCSSRGGAPTAQWFDTLELPICRVFRGVPDRYPREVDPAELINGVDRVHAALDALVAEGIPPERTIVAGFGQGAAIAMHGVLRYRFPLAGCAVLSAWVPCREALAPPTDYNAIADALKTREIIANSTLPALITLPPVSAEGRVAPFLWLHGALDRVVHADVAMDHAARLRNLGVQVDFRLFPEHGFGCSGDVIQPFCDWIVAHLVGSIPPEPEKDLDEEEDSEEDPEGEPSVERAHAE